MSTSETFPIESIHVPTKLKKTFNPATVSEIAESMLDIGQQTPVSVYRDGDRLVLVEGLHRLEACKALGETTILGVVVPAEVAQAKPLLAERPEVEAERLKMARLKQLRLEREAAEAAAAASKSGHDRDAPRSRVAPGLRDKARTSAARVAEARPKTLSDWITQQKGSGGRY
jgi:uncharacterized ParB-like nuclease family protein